MTTLPSTKTVSLPTAIDLATSDFIYISLRHATLKGNLLEVPDQLSDRCPSPRRDNNDIERIGREKMALLHEEAVSLQENLGGIVDRLTVVRQEYERLAKENRWLQEYIGSLMATGNLFSD